MKGLFVTATGTGGGKTTLTAARARALVADGLAVAALKPIETGVDPVAADARALAECCGDPSLADDPRWYRARLPAAPYAATLEGEPPLDLDRLVEGIGDRARDRFALGEGAGGLLVPIDRQRTLADLARTLALPLLVVAPDRLGVLSDTLAVVGAARAHGLEIRALVLSQSSPTPDPSVRTNARILAERLPTIPVIPLGYGAPCPPALSALTRAGS